MVLSFRACLRPLGLSGLGFAFVCFFVRSPFRLFPCGWVPLFCGLATKNFSALHVLFHRDHLGATSHQTLFGLTPATSQGQFLGNSSHVFHTVPSLRACLPPPTTSVPLVPRCWFCSGVFCWFSRAFFRCGCWFSVALCLFRVLSLSCLSFRFGFSVFVHCFPHVRFLTVWSSIHFGRSTRASLLGQPKGNPWINHFV